MVDGSSMSMAPGNAMNFSRKNRGSQQTVWSGLPDGTLHRAYSFNRWLAISLRSFFGAIGCYALFQSTPNGILFGPFFMRKILGWCRINCRLSYFQLLNRCLGRYQKHFRLVSPRLFATVFPWFLLDWQTAAKRQKNLPSPKNSNGSNHGTCQPNYAKTRYSQL